MDDIDFRGLSPAQLHALKAQALGAIEMLDATDNELKQRSAQASSMRKQVEQTMAAIDGRLHGGQDAGLDAESVAVARAGADPVLRRKLLAHPKAVLGDLGVKIPEEVNVTIVEDTPTKRYFVLPQGIGSSLRKFLTKLASDPESLSKFIDDPETAMNGANLENQDKAILRTGNFVKLYRELGVALPESLSSAPQQMAPAGQVRKSIGTQNRTR